MWQKQVKASCRNTDSTPLLLAMVIKNLAIDDNWNCRQKPKRKPLVQIPPKLPGQCPTICPIGDYVWLSRGYNCRRWRIHTNRPVPSRTWWKIFDAVTEGIIRRSVPISTAAQRPVQYQRVLRVKYNEENPTSPAAFSPVFNGLQTGGCNIRRNTQNVETMAPLAIYSFATSQAYPARR